MHTSHLLLKFFLYLNLKLMSVPWRWWDMSWNDYADFPCTVSCARIKPPFSSPHYSSFYLAYWGQQLDLTCVTPEVCLAPKTPVSSSASSPSSSTSPSSSSHPVSSATVISIFSIVSMDPRSPCCLCIWHGKPTVYAHNSSCTFKSSTPSQVHLIPVVIESVPVVYTTV
jgi:hypothetical protein